MRCSSALLLALPALAVADQVPLLEKLKGYISNAKEAVTSAIPAAPSSPVDAGAAKVAGTVQHELTADNWKQVLTVDPTASAPTTKDWAVFITGGNTTCFGLCGNASRAWNESVSVLAAKPGAPSFAVLDCEKETILCNSWSVGPPSIYYFSIPKPLADQSAPAPVARYMPLNRTMPSATDITKLITKYDETEPYEGLWHPFNGLLQQYQLAIPVGYVLWGFSKMPSWLPMILISFLSRSFMSRRMPQDRPQGAAAPAQ